MTTSTADIVDIEKMAYSVDEYAKQAVSGFKKVMTRAECGKGTSWSARVKKNTSLTSTKKDTYLGFPRLPVFPRIDDDLPSTPHDELGDYCGNRLGAIVGIMKVDF